MKSKHLSKESECGSQESPKYRFSSLKAAQRFLRNKGLVELHAYFCRHCKHVHVGH